MADSANALNLLVVFGASVSDILFHEYLMVIWLLTVFEKCCKMGHLSFLFDRKQFMASKQTNLSFHVTNTVCLICVHFNEQIPQT